MQKIDLSMYPKWLTNEIITTLKVELNKEEQNVMIFDRDYQMVLFTPALNIELENKVKNIIRESGEKSINRKKNSTTKKQPEIERTSEHFQNNSMNVQP